MGKQNNKLIHRMLIAIVSSFVLGFVLLIMKDRVSESVWGGLYSFLFADVTKESGFGILYVISTLFLNGLKLIIIPLVLTSLMLAMDSVKDMKKLGRIAYKTIGGFLGVYVLGCIVASIVAMSCVSLDIFTVSENIVRDTSNLTEINSANPMSILIAMVPDNLTAMLTDNNAILAVVFVAVVCGLCLNIMGEKGKAFKDVVIVVSDIIQMCVDFLINKVGPVAIFAMITRAMALYGFSDVKAVLVYVLVTIVVLIFYLLLGYPLVIFTCTRLNPVIFMKKIFKVALFAFSTISSAATLPLNTETTTKELGVKNDVANFVLPLGMTINMNGTAIMHVIGTTFIATVAGYHVTVTDLMMMSLLAIVASAGTPAIPAAGSVLLLTVVTGMGYTSDLALTTYALILAINKPVEMVLTSLNVVGDACVSVLVANSEGDLDKDVYNSTLSGES